MGVSGFETSCIWGRVPAEKKKPIQFNEEFVVIGLCTT